MAKASFTLPDGTTVQIDGSPEEIQKILSLHKQPPVPAKSETNFKQKNIDTAKDSPGSSTVNIADIVNTIKECKEIENIEKNIFDRSSQVDRILLPLYVLKKYINDKLTLTSGDISRILGDFGINIFTPNVTNTLSGAAAKYVIGDKVRKKGQVVRYKISRRGEQYLISVIENKASK